MATQRTWFVPLIRLLGILIVAGLILGSAYWLWVALPPTGWGAGSSAPSVPTTAEVASELPSGLGTPSVTGVRAAVLEDPRNEWATAPGFYAGEVERWRTWLAEAGAELVTPAEAELLVAPHLLCLDPALGALIQRHLRAGGGLITTGALGARDRECRPVADTLLAHFVGHSPGTVSELAAQTGAGVHYAIVQGETALGRGVPSGARLEFMPADHQLIFQGGDRELYYGDYSRRPISLGDEQYFDGAALRSRVAAGRVVAFGFALTHVVPGWSEEVAKLVIGNAVTWAAGRPVVQLSAWPTGAEVAVVFAQDIGAAISNAAWTHRLLRSSGLRGTFYIDGSQAAREGRLIRDIAATGEVGLRSDIGLTPADTTTGRRKLQEARRRLEEVVGQPIVGLRPEEARLGPELIRGWLGAGGDYVFGVNDGRVVAPELIPFGADTIVLLPRTNVNDYQLVVLDSILDRSEMMDRFIAELTTQIGLRGLYLFNFSSDILADPNLRPTLGTFVQTIRNNPRVWVTTAGEVARWSRARAAVHFDLLPGGGGVQVSNTGPTVVEGAILLIDQPAGTRRSVLLPRLEAGDVITVDLTSDSRFD